MKRLTAAAVAVIAVMIAVTTVFTISVRIPVPATQGYVNFSDVAIYFASFAFGPWVGLIAGGIGAALADIIGGYAQFSILTFLAHGLEGLLAGYFGRKMGLRGMLLGWALGTIAMVGLYLLGEGLVLVGWGPALVEMPFNILQNVVGALVGIPLVYAVRKAYPPIAQIGRARGWTEG